MDGVVIKSYERSSILSWHHTHKTKYAEMYRLVEECELGEWITIELLDAEKAENARSAMLTFARANGWTVTTSRNGAKLAIKRLK